MLGLPYFHHRNGSQEARLNALGRRRLPRRHETSFNIARSWLPLNIRELRTVSCLVLLIGASTEFEVHPRSMHASDVHEESSRITEAQIDEQSANHDLYGRQSFDSGPLADAGERIAIFNVLDSYR